MANTRRIDREIRLKKNKLERLQQQDSTALSAGDQAKLAGLFSIEVAKAARGKSAPAVERAGQRIWSRATEQAAADLSVLEAERTAAVQDEAKQRRNRKGWF